MGRAFARMDTDSSGIDHDLAIICRNYGEHICLASGWADVLFAYREKMVRQTL